MSEEKERKKKSDLSTHIDKNTLTSVSGSLAALFLKRNLEEGQGIEIPSLNIILKGKGAKK